MIYKAGIAGAALILAGILGASSAQAVSFGDDFESYPLGSLTVPNALWEINAHGVVVANPNATGNSSAQVLSFSGTDSGGDLFSKVISLDAGQTYQISFDYYGNGSNSGGFAGVSANNIANHFWYYSTAPGESGSNPILASNGTWNSYSYIFTAPVLSGVTDIRLMFEDFRSPGGNAFFDNITLTAVPVPAALPLLGSGLLALGIAGWRRRRRAAA